MFSLSYNRFILIVYIASAIMSLVSPTQTQIKSNSDIQQLLPNYPIEREIKGDESHLYSIDLAVGQYLYIVVDQKGVDVIVTLFDPDDNKLREIDSPNGKTGPESLFIVTNNSGRYKLEIHSPEKTAAGRYELKIVELKTANEQDRNRTLAEQAFHEADLLRTQQTPVSLQNAFKKYEEALPLFRVAANQRGEAMTLYNLGFLLSSSKKKQEALDYFQQALSIFKTIEDKRYEALMLHNMGVIYSELGEKQKALEYFQLALPVRKIAKDKRGEATTLRNIGLTYSLLRNKQEALEYYQQALLVWKAEGDKRNEALLLNDIGRIYIDLEEKQKALEFFQQSLPISRDIKDRRTEAITLLNIGGMYGELGGERTALEYFQQALKICREITDKTNEAFALNNLALTHLSLGERQKALEYFQQALVLFRELKSPRGEAFALNNIGGLFDDIGNEEKALEYYQQALTIWKAEKDPDNEATVLNNIGGTYDDLGNEVKAIEYFNKALDLIKTTQNRRLEASTLHNLGLAYSKTGSHQVALDYYQKALTLRRTVKDQAGEAWTLNNIGVAYDSLGDRRSSLENYKQALLLWTKTHNQAGEANTESSLMRIYGWENNPRLGIFWGKQAVNIYQELRSDLGKFDKDVQKNYLKAVERTYRYLAALLIEQGRLSEAQQVLNAFKDQQFYDFDQTRKKLNPLSLTPREKDLATLYLQATQRLNAIGGKTERAHRVSDGGKSNPEKAGQVQHADMQIGSVPDAFYAFIRQTETEFSTPYNEKDKVGETPETVQMQKMLSLLFHETKQKTVAVYTLITDQKLQALIVTDDCITSASSEIKSGDLNSKLRQLWGLLSTDDYDPRLLSNEIYKVVFEAIEKKLPKDTKTIMWSLDGNLRYIPIAALYDGKRYLVERYNNVLFTRTDSNRMTRSAGRKWTGYGFASSEPHKVEILGETVEFEPLDFAINEMQIFRTKDYPNGVLEGDVFPDAAFNKNSFITALKQKRPVVHISSHFSFRPGDDFRSFLLFGDGSIMTLSEMKGLKNLFQDVELLTLSACDTAVQRADANGREIDGFAELAQRLGASGVIASLWSVRDSSTSSLMKDFYWIRQEGKYSKAEALKKAQLELIYGKQKAGSPANEKNQMQKRSNTLYKDIIVDQKYRVPFRKDDKKPFAHPYYWSPFVLFGNWL